MSGIIDSAAAILLSSEKRVEAAGENIANAQTPAYKRQVLFSTALEQSEASATPSASPQAAVSAKPPQSARLTDLAQGKLVPTGKPLDIAMVGPGFVELRDADRTVFSRGGSFSLGRDGALVDADGRRLQSASGGPVTLDGVMDGTDIEILGDGTVLENGLPVAEIGLFEAESLSAMHALGGSLFSADEGTVRPAESSALRQGFVERSNVNTSDEMVAIMAAIRQAESGSRLVRTYDQMIGQAITTFSRSGS